MDNIISKDVVNNLIKVLSVAVEYSRHKESNTQELADSLRYFTGCEYPFFNGVFNNHAHQAATIKDNLSDITDYFTEKNTPFIWWWTQPSELPADIKHELDHKGFQFVGDFSGIGVKLNEVDLHAATENIDIRKVSSQQEYIEFINVVSEVFVLSETVKKDLTAMFQSYGLNGKFIHYIGLQDNQVVATLTSYIDGKCVGLYNGATLVKNQKKGLCSALAQVAIKEAIDLNCEYAVSQLMATAMAKGAAEKMGFKQYCRLLPFLKDPRITAQETNAA